MKRIVAIVLISLFVGVIISSCAGNKKCPAYTNKEATGQKK